MMSIAWQIDARWHCAYRRPGAAIAHRLEAAQLAHGADSTVLACTLYTEGAGRPQFEATR